MYCCIVVKVLNGDYSSQKVVCFCQRDIAGIISPYDQTNDDAHSHDFERLNEFLTKIKVKKKCFDSRDLRAG